MSIAVVLDSNSGVTKEEAKELGLFVRPMPFMVTEMSTMKESI